MENVVLHGIGLGFLGLVALATPSYAVLPLEQVKYETSLKNQTESIPIGDRTVRAQLPKPFVPMNNFTAQAGIRLPAGTLTNDPENLWGDQLISDRAGRDLATWTKDVLQWAKNHAQDFGLAADDIILQSQDIFDDGDLSFIKFRVRWQGSLIQDAFIDFRFKRGHLVQVFNMSYAGVKVATHSTALDTSSISLPSGWKSREEFPQKRFRIMIENGIPTLIPVLILNVEHLDQTYQLQWDLVHGQVYAAVPQNLYVAGTVEAEVYPRLYLDGATIQPVSGVKIADGNSTVQADQEGHFDVLGTPQLSGFQSSSVKVINSEGAVLTVPGQVNGNTWKIDVVPAPANEPYEGTEMAQVMGYVHVQKIIQMARQYLPIPWLDTQLVVAVNHDDTCNAYWNGTSLNFYKSGDGCANSALMSDVIYHEWGHGLDANTGGIEDQAFSEGFGDIMFLVMTGEHQMAPGFFVDGRGIRDLAIPRKYPDDLKGEAHYDGQIISSTFWDLYQELKIAKGEASARALISRYAFKVIPTASRMTDVYEALKVIDDDDGILNNGTPNLCLMNTVFKKHGLAEADHSCWLGVWRDTRINDDQDGNHNGILDPGETVRINLQQFNNTHQTIDNLMVTLKSKQLLVQFQQDTVHWGILQDQQIQWGNEDAIIHLDDGIACGTRFDITATYQGAGKSIDQQKWFEVGRYIGTEHTYHLPSALPFPIPDGVVTDYKIPVADMPWDNGMAVYRGHIKLSGAHVYSREVYIDLISPDGDLIPVYRAGIGRNPPIVVDMDLTPRVFGKMGKGDWILRVRDANAGDRGRLMSFELVLEPAHFTCAGQASN